MILVERGEGMEQNERKGSRDREELSPHPFPHSTPFPLLGQRRIHGIGRKRNVHFPTVDTSLNKTPCKDTCLSVAARFNINACRVKFVVGRKVGGGCDRAFATYNEAQSPCPISISMLMGHGDSASL